MLDMPHPLHHIHIRKRIYRNRERYPSSKKRVRLMDKLVYVAAILGPVMTIPQLAVVYLERNVAGLSFVSWFSYIILNMIWLSYGILHKDRPIIITSAAWAVMHGLVAFGIVLYGRVF